MTNRPPPITSGLPMSEGGGIIHGVGGGLAGGGTTSGKDNVINNDNSNKKNSASSSSISLSASSASSSASSILASDPSHSHSRVKMPPTPIKLKKKKSTLKKPTFPPAPTSSFKLPPNADFPPMFLVAVTMVTNQAPHLPEWVIYPPVSAKSHVSLIKNGTEEGLYWHGDGARRDWLNSYWWCRQDPTYQNCREAAFLEAMAKYRYLT
ncbi:hypothetical protein HDU76_006026, partial [Blyttiomyces sp. JEL0837]